MSRWFVILLALAGTGSAAAQQLISNIGIGTSVIFSDNLFSSTTNKESGAVVQVLPSISGGNHGARSSYRYFYGPSALIYMGGHSDLNRVVHVLQANATVSLIEDYLGLNLSARANQNLISPAVAQPTGFDSLGNPDAYAQTAGVSVTPIIRLPLVRGKYATLRIAPGINYTFTSDTASGQSNIGQTGSSSSITLTSGDYFSRLPWQLVWSGNSVLRTNGNSAGDSNEYNSFSFNASYRWSQDLIIKGSVGYDDNSYSSQGDTQGLRWRITPTWSPTSRTTIGIGYGHRYFGNDWYLNWQHRLRHLVFNLQYETTISDARNAILNQDVVTFENPFGEPVDPALAQGLPGTSTTPILVNDTYVQNRFRGTLAWRRGRNGISLNAWRSEYKYQQSDVSYLDTYSTLSYRRSLTPTSSGSLYLSFQKHDEQSGSVSQQSDYNLYRLSLQWSKTLSQHMTASVLYSFITRESGSGLYDYDENRLYMTLNWQQ